MRARIALTRLGSRLDVCGTREFHVRRAVRDACDLPDTLFAVRGDVVLGSAHASSTMAHALSEKMGISVSPASLRAMGLVHEILHGVLALYRQRHPEVLAGLVPALEASLGAGLDHALRVMLAELPPTDVYRGRATVDQWLARPDGDVSGKERALEELLLLYVANENRAYAPIHPVIDDTELRLGTAYGRIVGGVRTRLEEAPRFGPDGQLLLDMLLAPAAAAPGSIFDQLSWMRERWGLVLAEAGLLEDIHVPFGMRAEEAWLGRKSHGKPAGDGGPMRFDAWQRDHEYEAFSPDTHWMPNVVMIAKSTFVWLDQLSRFHDRPIRTLADIPEEEIEKLAGWGITALWLIGVWRRSKASARIKHHSGNHEALSSAYSLDGYDIAPELGGHEAYQVLRQRAARHGIRLASDMVPNHMGVDSRWVIDHPDWFLGLDHPPYPGYRFDGPDLSDDARVGIYLEDGYWSKTDAAVVFKRVDRWTGSARYIYHGNDGTSMPWNDTAQLDYTKAHVREAVIQTILHVARMFPIIRFDAAMTLAKRHYQRLWFPAPGSEGAVPSRAEHGLSKPRFDEVFPQEFWREVVDRVAAEAPDTLLLAEAFWLMEGYFVRTLGMHRVYNSAFMNMLKKEDNLDFRMTIKNVLEFEPQVLKRFVNFMNNPDEDTAIAQFGDGDKYFGVCALLATLPGLPMLGHGQIEGFTEKYGMEFARARHAEDPKPWMVARHEREIFPLLRRRWMFADVERFRLYDAVLESGAVCEDVIAYSNGAGGANALVAYHNRYAEAEVRIKDSVAFRTAGGDLARVSLVDALGLAVEDDLVLVGVDSVSRLEHVYGIRELAERGLPMTLRAFEYRVIGDLRVERATKTTPWVDLARRLGGRGVRSADDAVAYLSDLPVLAPLRVALGADHTHWLEGAAEEDIVRGTQERFADLAKGAAYAGSRAFAASAYADACADLLWAARERAAEAAPPWHLPVTPFRVAAAVLQLREAVRCLARVPRFDALARELYVEELGEQRGLALADLVVALVAAVPETETRPASVPPPAAVRPSVAPPAPSIPAAPPTGEAPLSTGPRTLPSAAWARPTSEPPPEALAAAFAVPPLGAPPRVPEIMPAPLAPLGEILRGALMQRFLDVHEWQGTSYFVKERFECVLTTMVLVGDVDSEGARALSDAAEASGWDFTRFADAVRAAEETKTRKTRGSERPSVPAPTIDVVPTLASPPPGTADAADADAAEAEKDAEEAPDPRK